MWPNKQKVKTESFLLIETTLLFIDWDNTAFYWLRQHCFLLIETTMLFIDWITLLFTDWDNTAFYWLRQHCFLLIETTLLFTDWDNTAFYWLRQHCFLLIETTLCVTSLQNLQFVSNKWTQKTVILHETDEKKWTDCHLCGLAETECESMFCSCVVQLKCQSKDVNSLSSSVFM